MEKQEEGHLLIADPDNDDAFGIMLAAATDDVLGIVANH